MITSIKLNLETIEAMLYFWNAVKDRENVSEMFIYDLTSMQGLTLAYDANFTEESVRRALSALKNREIFSRSSREEGRFYNNNLWMMEDLEYTNLMVAPIKKLNLDYLIDELNSKFPNSKYNELEVYFSPLHLDEYLIKDNKLIINFFRVKPSDFDENTFVGDKELRAYIKEKLEELLNN
ncbi:hypothetical protein NBE98_12215 [Clostridium swellfunianum]|uniref:TDE2712 family protein n=1 Tax=Clostridium swellfunianum TaxID=1367462 RepID=UPI00202E2FBD|nr:hypothetical protein [Clostridium swellfunianum]MCM0649140.1 hypothetical protein [Clostridium swellfunianum]